MNTAEIRQRWLNYFEKNGHTVVPSASLVSDDPTLLFTVAGMVPFIPYLTGVVPAPYSRATSVQKCIRTLDIDEVGKTTRHGTFFQMNGNFSFGDYFKQEAIGYAWELLTSSETDGGYGFAERDLWVTIYEDDNDAFAYWKKLTGIPDDRIQRLGKDSNYWSTGVPGPAGPCSEIFFDRGPAYGIDGGPATDSDRYLEIWNLVFMQYLRGEGRGKDDFDILGELPSKNIDTGMGLERVAFLKQGVENIYEIDQVRPVLDTAAAIAGKKYGADHENDVRLRVVADHIRSSLMLMSDGVTPSNEGRGYILRRLLRRSVRSMRLLGVDSAVFPELFASSRDAMKSAYPEVETEYDRISRAAIAEEESFLRTLSSGITILDTAVTSAKAAGTTALKGDTAFSLHDTYGFPIDLTVEMAEEAGLAVDRAAFETLMNEQKARAKADSRAKKQGISDLGVYTEFRAAGETTFLGYDELVADSSVLGILVDGVSVASAVAGEKAEIILAETTLYAESGGQEADSGTIVGDGFSLEVLDVQKPVKGLISHRVEVTEGQVAVGDAATTKVDEVWRRGATAAHSGTHLVHAALRQVLGSSAHQAGSYNKAGYLRLDFSWNQALSAQTRSEIEDIANNAIREDLPVLTRELPLDEAKALGAMALFGEKYGDVVRVVDIGGPWSRELCAGTHVRSSAQIGLINVIGESSIGSTNRRIESFVGADAFRAFATERAIVSTLSANLKTPKDALAARIQELTTNLKLAEKKVQAFEQKALLERVPALIAGAQSVNGVRVVSENLGSLASADDVRQLVIAVRERIGSDAAVISLAGEAAGKAVVIVASNEAARAAGRKAGALAKIASGILGGGGGGKDDLAQGGGPNTSAIADALEGIIDTLRLAS